MLDIIIRKQAFIWSDFLHDKVLSFLECFAIKKLYIDFTGFTFYNVS